MHKSIQSQIPSSVEFFELFIKLVSQHTRKREIKCWLRNITSTTCTSGKRRIFFFYRTVLLTVKKGPHAFYAPSVSFVSALLGRLPCPLVRAFLSLLLLLWLIQSRFIISVYFIHSFYSLSFLPYVLSWNVTQASPFLACGHKTHPNINLRLLLALFPNTESLLDASDCSPNRNIRFYYSSYCYLHIQYLSSSWTSFRLS